MARAAGTILSTLNKLSMVALALGIALASVIVSDQRGDAAEREARSRKVVTKPLVLVINYPYQITGKASTKIHVTLFKPDFSPAKGATVSVNGKEMGVADENGTCIFDYVPGNSQSHTLKAVLGEGEKGAKIVYKVTKAFSCNARTGSFRSDQLFVYTDRGVYNPGDTVLVRLLAWELLADYTAIPNAEVSVLLQSLQGKVFSGEKVKTNEFGVAALKLPLPPNMPEGDMELVVLYNQARERARLRVERFVPPVIDIQHDLARFLTPAQESLEVNVSLAYFSGGKPKGAAVKAIVQDAQGSTLLAEDVTETGDGKYKLTLEKTDLDAVRAKLTAELPFKFALEATDKFGRTSKVTRDMVYTQRPYHAVLELDKDDYPAGETVKLQAKVKDLDGKPARGISLTVRVDEFDVTMTAVTDDQGVAEFSFPMGKAHGNAVVTSPVMPVPLGSVALRLNRPKPMTSKVSEPPQKEGIRTNFDVTFDRDYIPVEKVIHVDFTDLSGSLVTSGTIPITKEADGSYVSKGTIAAPTWGTMLANLYVCAAHKDRIRKDGKLTVAVVGFITEGQHVTLYPDAEATITVTGLKPRVKPGEKVDIKVEVRTRSGQEAALGASLVDNAVVSLMDPLEVTPRDHFYAPDRKVIASSGAGVLTWPVVDRNWGTPWRDIAYTDWGFKAPGGMVHDTVREGGASGGGPGGAGGIGMAAPSASDSGVVAKEEAKKKKTVQYMFSDTTVDGDLLSPAAPPAAKPVAQAKAEEAAGEDELGDLSKSGLAMGRRTREGGAAGPAPSKKITIRTKFPETAMWEPLLATKSGSTDISLTFPDAITVQKLTLIATDKAGGIGILRQDVEVRQDLFVQSDIPAYLTLGDEVRIAALIRNLSGRSVTVTVNPAGSGIEIVGDGRRTLTIPDGESEVAAWSVRAAYAGKVSWSLSVEGDTFLDEEHRSVFVKPAGAPASRMFKGTLASGKPLTADLELDLDATYRSVFLNVTFPNIVPALQVFDAVKEWPIQWVGVSGVASRAILDSALLEWGRHGGMKKDEIEALRARLLRAAAELAAAQNADGSWGWWYMADASQKRDGYRVSVYLSAYALRALTAAWKADALTSTEAIAKGIEFIMKSRNKEGLWSPEGAWFWVVNAPETDIPLSADLFDVVVEASRAISAKPSADLKALKDRFRKYLKSAPDEPAGIAHAVSGLMHFAAWEGNGALKEEVAGSLQLLLALKRQGHWEPHWYHAYGGMVELNAQILALLRELGTDGLAAGDEHAALEYEIVTWLLSTRESWGAWHNEIGTANAVHALLLAGAGAKKEIPSEVAVTVNGKVVATIPIDPDDPFVSAAKLRHFELTDFLAPGGNTVTVTYDGALDAPVLVEVNEWGLDERASVPPAGLREEDVKDSLTVTREAATSTDMGAPVEVTLRVLATKGASHVHVVDSIPSNMEPDARSLEALVKSGQIRCYEVKDDRVLLVLDMSAARGKTEAAVTYSLVANREGRGEHQGTTATAAYDPTIAPATFTGDAVVVIP